jgi:predicted nuclease with TOPRIM domain
MMKNEIERLKERVKELKGKVKKLKEKLRERIENEELHENMIEMCEEECLHNDVEEFELVFPLLSDNFKLCLLDLKKVKSII